jgi:SnoaL-like domain
MTQNEFRQLLEAVATGWSTGDVTLATGCFTPDAIYTEPPRRRYFRGRDDLFYSFGGENPAPMSMSWHHVVFDEAAGIGAGEYTFTCERRYHGVVMVRVVNGLIANWREYRYESELDWPAFCDVNRF